MQLVVIYIIAILSLFVCLSVCLMLLTAHAAGRDVECSGGSRGGGVGGGGGGGGGKCGWSVGRV